MRTILLAAALPLAALAACNTQDAANTAAAGNVTLAPNGTIANDTDAMDANVAAVAGESATAALTTADGTAAGSATITQDGPNLAVAFNGAALPAGVHAVHIHTTGKCDAPKFESAGGHWNPTAKQHGRDNPQGQHQGDLPNMTVAADGTGSVTYTVANATLAGLLDADGAAFMVHEKADDYRTDPTGDAGGRIACGVLTASLPG